MLKVKDTLRSTVSLTFDGRVVKSYHGPNARERFDNEIERASISGATRCKFVPRLLEADPVEMRIVTTSCGARVERIDDERVQELLAELEKYGVRHDDPDPRNITYRQSDGRFCLIDFELATILSDETPEAPAMNPPQAVSSPASLKWSGYTDRGKVRPNNEDAFLALRFDAKEVHRLRKSGETSTAKIDFAFAVSDGMGGALAGEYASRIAMEKITTLLPRSFKQSATGFITDYDDVLTELFGEVHKALVYLGASYEECDGMEATLTLCWFTPGWMHFGHIGDSRLYYLPAKEDKIKQLSHDDTHVGWLFRNGKISEWEARTHPRRSVLQKALGGGNQFVDPQLGAVGYESRRYFSAVHGRLGRGAL